MRSCWKFAILALVLIKIASSEALASSTLVEPLTMSTLTIGRATRDVGHEKRRWQRLLIKLNEKDATRFRPTFDLHITSSKAGLLWDFWDRKVNVFIGNPFLAASLIREADAVPLLVIEEREPSHQRSVIIVRESDEAEGLADLSGRRLAFARHGSDLVHLLPHSMLLSQGMIVVEMGENAEVPSDRIAAFHLHDDRSPLMWLYRSTTGARAAAVSMRDFQDVERRRPELFRPVLTSPPIPMAIAVAAAAVDPASRLALTEHLERERAELFRALDYEQHKGVRLRRVTSQDAAIIDLVQRVDAIEASAANER